MESLLLMRRKAAGAVEQFVQFIKSQSQSVQVMNGRFMFANEADAATFSDLQNTVLKMQKQLNQSP